MDAVIAQLHERLRSLDEHCLTNLEQGLVAMRDGDFTVPARLVTEPLLEEIDDPQVRALADLFNAMLGRAQNALGAYEELRTDLAAALGDRSCLPELEQRLAALDRHCLSGLDHGLQRMAEGDLTFEAKPVTRPLVAAPGDDLGSVGKLFNEMLAKSRTALRSYDTIREDLRCTLGDRSCLDALRDRLQSLHRHCLRDLEEGLEALAEGTALTRQVAPVTTPLEAEGDLGDLGTMFNRALRRAQASTLHFERIRRRTGPAVHEYAD